jgi:hypothetical protein
MFMMPVMFYDERGCVLKSRHSGLRKTQWPESQRLHFFGLDNHFGTYTIFAFRDAVSATEPVHLAKNDRTTNSDLHQKRDKIDLRKFPLADLNTFVAQKTSPQ